MARVRPFSVFPPDGQLLVAIVRIVAVVANALCPTAGNDATGSGGVTDLVCDNGRREFNVLANSSAWSFATLQPANQYFSGECKIDISYEADRMNPTGPSLKPGLVLLKIRWQRAGAVQAAAGCSGASHYVVMNRNSSLKSKTLCDYSTYYVWARSPVVIYMTVAYRDNNFPFASISFLDVSSPTNICGTSNKPVEVHAGSMAYAYAPSSMFSAVNPNDADCSMTINYTLSIFATSSTDRLSLTVLSAPGEHSGWSLLANERRLRDGDSLSSDNRNNLVIFYIYNSRSTYLEEKVGDSASGFTAVATLFREAVSTELPDRILTSENATVQFNTKAGDLSAYSVATASKVSATQEDTNATAPYNQEPFSVVVVSCSAAAGAVVIALVSALIATLFVRRYRCRCRQCKFEDSKDHHGGDVEITMATGAPPTKTTFSCNVSSPPSEALVEALYSTDVGEVALTMTDNALYSTSLRH